MIIKTELEKIIQETINNLHLKKARKHTDEKRIIIYVCWMYVYFRNLVVEGGLSRKIWIHNHKRKGRMRKEKHHVESRMKFQETRCSTMAQSVE